MAKFRKKPVVIEAIRWVGDNADDVHEFGMATTPDKRPQHRLSTGEFLIPTPEGTLVARVGDWIIKGVKGELYPCKPDIFEATYEAEPPRAQERP